jgi:MFS transporter, PAT family, beta-lactamase induction signal transducer AmpG
LNSEIKASKSPWLFIPTQYFAEGLPYVIVNSLSVVMLKSLNISNELIGFTSFLYLPWSLKPLWAPLVDGRSTKRNWILYMQIAMALSFFILALLTHLPSIFVISIVIFFVVAFLSATHDVATDGFYLHALNKDDQAFFSGIRSTFYRLATIFGSGILVIVAGEIGSHTKNYQFGWSIAFLISGLIFVLFYLYHRFVLPYPATDAPVRTKAAIPFKESFKGYFSQKGILPVITFIIFYRFGEALLLKMAQPFLLDKSTKGGLGLTVSDVGIIYGTLGVLALVIGGILGGWLIKKYGLRRLIWPLAILMNTANLLYVYMAIFRPVNIFKIDLSWFSSLLGFGTNWVISLYSVVAGCVVLEQFGYGIGFSAFMVYLLYISKGEFKTTYYAISTGIMAVGMMVPGFISGWMQVQVGYTWFFIISTIATIPGMITIWFLPKDSIVDNT